MMEKLYMKRLQHTIALTLSIAGGLYHMAWAAPAATALPTGEQDMKNATVTRDTSTSPTNPVMTIEQTKGQSKAFISWETFNIGKDATVNIKQYSGADLLVNAINWMAQQEDKISIRSKSLETGYLTVSAADSRRWSILLVGVIPAALIAVGAVVIIRRKRK